jgi:hypothetical protein
MKLLNNSYDQAHGQPDASHSGVRFMCAGNEAEIELVRQKLFEAGIPSETRRHPLAEAFGVNGLELWVENERDFFNASRLYNLLQKKSANGPEASTVSLKVSGPKPQTEPVGTLPREVTKIDSPQVAEPRRLELKEASSLLQKGIEALLVRESELTGQCTALQGKIDELTGTLAKARADVAREIEGRESAARDQAQQLNRVLETLTRERREWQEKLKSSDDTFKNAKEQIDSLSRQLQTHQAAATALKQELAALKLQRDQQERFLSEARKETAAEREARVAAEKRAGSAEQSLETEWLERQELERQIQASLGSLLAKVNSKAPGSGEP